jgi:diguanylate cyclase (GGDEF)-like protein
MKVSWQIRDLSYVEDVVGSSDNVYSRLAMAWWKHCLIRREGPESKKMNLVIDANGLTAAPSGEIIRTDSILVADDDAISRTMLEACLRKWNFSVTTAQDGLYAWHELQKESAPRLIILDWMMPGFSGVDLCRKIRARKTQHYPYILLLTSKDAKQDLVEGLNAGADDYLIKPFEANELRSRLQVGSRILSLQNDLLRKEEDLRFEVLHDRLTGLWSRGAILDSMEREMARSKRSGDPVGALMLDIDHFKTINDTYGHQAGDSVLKEVAQRLAGGTRSYDWAGRYGGEEFLVLLCNCNPDMVATCAERLRESVAAEPVRVADLDLAVTVSVGAAVSSAERSLTSDQLIGLADAALYRAKHRGRNVVEMGR